MGVFIKNDIEKILKQAEQKAITPDKNDVMSSYGDRMKDELATLMGRDKVYSQHLEGTISGGSFILSPLNRLTAKGRAFEKTMDNQDNEEYNSRFKRKYHMNRNRTEEEREPDNPIYNGFYRENGPEFIQDVEHVKERTGFATHRGKNNITVDLVLTGKLFYDVEDDAGFKHRKLADTGLFTMRPQSVSTGQFNEKGDEEIMRPDVDNFQHAYAKRVEAAKAINEARLKELGYDLLERGDDGYVEQQYQIDQDPRFIETFPDLSDLPIIKDINNQGYQPEYDVVIHINGQKVQPQDVDLAFQQLTRKGAYEKPGLEAGRDFLVQQGVRGAAFHASVFPQRVITGAVKTPEKMAHEGQQALTGTVLQQLMGALSRGMQQR